MLEQQEKLDAQQKKINEENARIQKEKEEKEAQEKLEKETKYKNFLKKNE